MKAIRLVALTAAMLVAAAGTAPADQQDKAQQACLNKIVKSARKISGAVLKDASACIRRAAKDALPDGVTAQDCLSADLKGKVQKAAAKIASAIATSCPTDPDFGYTDAATVEDGYVTENLGLMYDAFEEDLDATLAASSGADPQGKCSSTITGAWRKLHDAMHKEVERCLKIGLKDGTVVDAASMEGCLDSITTDAQGRVLKAAGTVQALLSVKCPAGDLAGIYPGLSGICGVYGDDTDAAGLASCSIERLECRVCRIFDAAYALDRDCDLFDDALANGSCPDCGNTVIDAGEGCDDGNEISGDGCTSACVDEFCGDGTINDNGAEECDDGLGNSNTTPDACRENCTEPICGDGVTDTGEECDDGNMDEDDGCTTACTSCGNGSTSGPEACDDGNNDNGDCCAADCTFEAAGSSCTDAPDGVCTSPQCNGAGVCAEAPDNQGGACDDGDECSSASACNLGNCTATSYVVTGVACRWLAVGNPGTDNDKRIDVNNGVQSTGDWCGNFGVFGQNSVTDGDIVTTRGDNTTPGTEFDSFANVDGGDIVTNNARVSGVAGASLPGVGFSSIGPGQQVNKTPSPTFYDTTGDDVRVDECIDAQTAISTSTAGLLNAQAATQNLGATFTGITGGSTKTITATNPGGLNVIDLDNITGGNNVTINLDGGGSANTVMILRIATSLNSDQNWIWNLQNGLTADHLLIYSKGTGNARCEIGEDNTGGGTLFCPNGRIVLKIGTDWDGALFGGGSSVTSIELGDNVVLTHNRFTGL
ncbi:MAG TPA: DUF4215 domain-containing protein [Candidatus Limnocylindrales bacterium]|nr:DUF4215 domain-containing protein [Candidatus Limnocylindrales bacterium]